MNADIQYDAASIKSQDFPLRDMHLHAILDQGVMTLNPDHIRFHARQADRFVPAGCAQRRRGQRSGCTAEQCASRAIYIGQSASPRRFAGRARQAPRHRQQRAQGSGECNRRCYFRCAERRHAQGLCGADGHRCPEWTRSAADERQEQHRSSLCRGSSSMPATVRWTARQLTFDTDNDLVLVQGQGTVNLKDETLDMSITGHPKAFRIGRIRAPITITGIDRSSVCGREGGRGGGWGGIAAALGFLNAFAAILAFVDPGLAKDANCAALTQTAARSETGEGPYKGFETLGFSVLSSLSLLHVQTRKAPLSQAGRALLRAGRFLYRSGAAGYAP